MWLCKLDELGFKVAQRGGVARFFINVQQLSDEGKLSCWVNKKVMTTACDFHLS